MYSALPAWGEQQVDHSYAGLLVRADRAELLGYLADARFDGYIGPQEADWVVVVPARPRHAVTRGGAQLEALGAALALRFDEVSLAAAVHRDRVLRLVMWRGSSELGRYLSDPAYGADEDDEVFPEPQGVEYAEAFAAACGSPDQAEDLAEVLGEILDEDEQIESERLAGVLRLLGLPRWLVAADSLPKDVPGGPSAAQVIRLFRGRTGLAYRALAGLSTFVRRSR